MHAPFEIRIVELAKPTIAVIEEQRPGAEIRCKITGDDVRPAGRVGRTRELVNATLSIGTIELCWPTIAVIEEQRGARSS